MDNTFPGILPGMRVVYAPHIPDGEAVLMKHSYTLYVSSAFLYAYAFRTFGIDKGFEIAEDFAKGILNDHLTFNIYKKFNQFNINGNT